MRRIHSKYHEEKKRKRNQMIVGLILVFVMFSSVLGFAFITFSQTGGEVTANDPGSSSVNYNGFEFTEQNGFWVLNKNEINFIFRYNPHQVDKISSEIRPLENYRENTLYLYSENILAESEIRTNLFQFTGEIKNACLEECDEEFVIKTCQDNFIIIREGNKGITQENNCIFIEGKKEDLIKLADEFLFKLIGIDNL